ncbi:hypothetical protein DPMN_103540 [Dreissena polymorpha]|uniref:Uncharacterized protein n=1 Tax=Dreissena polymorpha TaxID=45954 RepID=A0A9D4JZ98_DREPO|nr:hypothetical protein DPMN_103540 [Dreissena polymorpha]
MGNALANNTTLKSLDLANNRIHQQALFELMKGLEKNKTLVVLKVCNQCVVRIISFNGVPLADVCAYIDKNNVVKKKRL